MLHWAAPKGKARPRHGQRNALVYDCTMPMPRNEIAGQRFGRLVAICVDAETQMAHRPGCACVIAETKLTLAQVTYCEASISPADALNASWADNAGYSINAMATQQAVSSPPSIR